jgi:hypothetical protein
MGYCSFALNKMGQAHWRLLSKQLPIPASPAILPNILTLKSIFNFLTGC